MNGIPIKIVKNLYHPKPPLNFKFFKNHLNGEKIYIADVGSTGGPERQWVHFLPFCHFYAFDPDPRATTSPNYSNEIFPIGLWSTKEIKDLYLAKFPPASGLFPFHENLKTFLNFPCHEIVKTIPIQVDSMENVLQKHPPPDFIKIDAEGADLEILKGSRSFLKNPCLGVRVEVSFNHRHKNAPLFSEIDLFLRDYGFQLFDVQKQRWLRRNQTFGFHSKPQLMWGNAAYFLTAEELFKRLEILPFAQQKTQLTKFLLLLLVYRFYDYAVEVLEEAFKREFIDSWFYSESLKQIRSCASKRSIYLIRLLFSMGIGFMACLFLYPYSSLRSKATGFLKGRVRQFSQALLNAVRDGPYNAEVIEEEEL